MTASLFSAVSRRLQPLVLALLLLAIGQLAAAALQSTPTGAVRGALPSAWASTAQIAPERS